MEITKNEVEAAQQAANHASDLAIAELAALELAMVGGGSGNDIFC